jgi:hypothetical protein
MDLAGIKEVGLRWATGNILENNFGLGIDWAKWSSGRVIF